MSCVKFRDRKELFRVINYASPSCGNFFVAIIVLKLTLSYCLSLSAATRICYSVCCSVTYIIPSTTPVLIGLCSDPWCLIYIMHLFHLCPLWHKCSASFIWTDYADPISALVHLLWTSYNIPKHVSGNTY